MNLGDFVNHTRQGPGRITGILPDYIEVKSRSGNVYKVSKAVAEYELIPVPADGFIALLATRDLSSDFLMDNIVEVVQRVFRDRRRLSLSRKEIREVLEPFLKREGQSYPAWWKRAEKKLLSSKIVVADPKKKTNLVHERHSGDSAAQDWAAEFERVSNGAELLDFARRLYAAESEDEGVSTVACSVIERIGRKLSLGGHSPRGRLELLIALSYVGSRADQDVRSDLSKIIDSFDLSNLPITRDLDEDISVALALLAKLTPRKAAEWATGLLEHPSALVAKRSFATLNNDRFRLTLKKTLIDWLRSDSISIPLHLDLYVDEGFLSYLRREDKAELYTRLSRQAEPSAAVRTFLSRPENIRAAVERGADNPGEAIRKVSSNHLDGAAISQFVNTLGSDALLEGVLERLQPNDIPFVVEAIKSVSWSSLLRHAPKLISAMATADSLDVRRMLGQRLLGAAQELVGLELLRAIELGFQLELAPDAEHDSNLVRALQAACSKLITTESPELSLLSAAVQTEIATATSECERRLGALQEELSAAVERAQRAEQEVKRLQAVVSIIKASAGGERIGAQYQAVREFVISLLPVIDELQRRTDAGDGAAQVLMKDLVSAFQQAGITQIGHVGMTEPFDPQRHSLLRVQENEPDRVVIVRSGYMLTQGTDHLVVRFALVRPVEEKLH